MKATPLPVVSMRKSLAVEIGSLGSTSPAATATSVNAIGTSAARGTAATTTSETARAATRTPGPMEDAPSLQLVYLKYERTLYVRFPRYEMPPARRSTVAVLAVVFLCSLPLR